MQVIIGENFAKLEAAQKDQHFVQFQQQKYDEVSVELEKHLRLAKDVKDAELEEHFKELDNF